MNRQTTFFLLLVLALALAGGCTESTESADSGITIPDGSADSALPPFVGSGTCETPQPITGSLGTVRIDLDTTDGVEGALDLGADCGNPEGIPRAPQEVIAYTVPGDGLMGVTFDTALGDTLTNFDTVVQVRTSCTEIPTADAGPSCFDDVSGDDTRSRGGLMAMGGDVIYFVVTGFTDTPLDSAIDRGPISIEITARSNALPEVTGGEVRIVGERTQIVATGTDADEDVIGVRATFVDAAGALVDLNGDGMENDRLSMGFDVAPVGNPFTGTSTLFVIRLASGGVYLSDRLRMLGATGATLILVDEVFGESAGMSVPVRFLDEVGLGASCGADAGCTLDLECVSGVCEAGAEIAALCETSTTLTLTAPTTETTSAGHEGQLPGGHGLIESSCAHTPGQEALFDVTVPAGDMDLIVSTDLVGSGTTDTVVYVRTACPDRLSEPTGACNDNFGGYQSRVELRNAAAGAYTVFVVKAGHPSETPIPYEVEVSLRPVLGTGAACDPAEVTNRCSAGACPTGGAAECP